MTKEKKLVTSIALPEWLHRAIKRAAIEDNRTVTNYIETVLRRELEKAKEE